MEIIELNTLKEQDIQDLLGLMEVLDGSIKVTPEILKLLIKEIQVHSNRRITIVFNFSDPYRSIYELQNCVEKVRQVG